MLQKHKYIKKERIRYRKTKTFKAKKGENEKGEKFLVGMLHIQKKPTRCHDDEKNLKRVLENDFTYLV